jgi:hypothetical protein
MLVLGKNGNMPAWDRLPGLTLILPATISLRTQPAAKKPCGKMVKNTEILGEFRRTLSRFSAAN